MTAHTTAHQTNFQKLIEKNHASVSLRRKVTNAVIAFHTGMLMMEASIILATVKAISIKNPAV